jgi:hypothetical protein
MLLEKLVLQEQECEGSYIFHSEPICTKGFIDKFGDIASELVDEALLLISITYENPDWLQVFYYGDRKFWVISDFERSTNVENYNEIKKLYVIFMLPEEY